MTDKEKKEIELILGCVFLHIKDGLLDRAWDVYDEFEKQFKHFIDSMQEEHVSDNLEEAAFDYAESCKYDGGEKLLCVEHFKAGAKWQKEQDQSTIELAEDHAMLAGMEKMKEKMMKSAVTGQIENGDDFLRIKCLSTSCKPEDNGKLVKLIIIKED